MVFLDVWEEKLQSESWMAKGPNIRNGSRITRSYPLGLVQKRAAPVCQMLLISNSGEQHAGKGQTRSGSEVKMTS